MHQDVRKLLYDYVWGTELFSTDVQQQFKYFWAFLSIHFQVFSSKEQLICSWVYLTLGPAPG